jgi:hypothetical protein
MPHTRRSLFALLAAPGVALAQATNPATPPQINALEQIRGIANASAGGPYDAWVAAALSPDPNGTQTVWTLPATPRKISVYLNGVRQFASTEVNAGVASHFSISGAVITFAFPPQVGDHIVVETTA